MVNLGTANNICRVRMRCWACEYRWDVVVRINPVALPPDICPTCGGIANAIQVEWLKESKLVPVTLRDVHLENLRRLNWRLLTAFRKARQLEDMREVMQELQTELIKLGKDS